MTHAEMVRESIVYQNDPALPEAFRRYGCRARVLMAIPEFVMGAALTVDQIVELITRGRGATEVIVNDKMRCGQREHQLINWAFEALGADRAGRQVGWIFDHIDTRDWQYMVAHWRTDGPDGHFTLLDRREREIFDPWTPELSGGYEINKQWIARRLLYATWGTA